MTILGTLIAIVAALYIGSRELKITKVEGYF